MPLGRRTPFQPHVIYSLAADGVGTTNGQLGGMVELGSEIALPFITNRSVAQDLDAGTWPDIDESISMQIREAAAAGTDIGLLLAPKGGTPSSEIDATWVEAEHTDGTTLTRLKSATYGPSLVLIAWAEASGGNFNRTYEYFTMVVDRDGAVCQPRTALPAAQGFAAGDDLVNAPDGSIVWANVDGGRIQVHRLLP